MNIYEQHDKHFELVSAYVIAKDGERIGTIAFKFPRDGAGRLYCYLHVLGLEMVRGVASGGGYDKRSGAAFSAAKRIDMSGQEHALHTPEMAVERDAYRHAYEIQLAIKDAGHDWCHDLREAGFEVWQAV